MKRSAGLLLATAIPLCVVVAQAPAVLDARVTDADGRPMAGAMVSVAGYDRGGQTGADGRSVLTFPKGGTYVAVVSRLGFGPVRAPLVLAPGDTTKLDFILEPVSPVLPAVRVTTVRESIRLAKAGFYDRREHSGAPPSHFMARDEIERRRPLVTSELLLTLGARAKQCVRGRIFVDGVPATNRRGDALDLLAVSDIEGIEVYAGPAEIPAQFNARAAPGAPIGCVLLIWTR